MKIKNHTNFMVETMPFYMNSYGYVLTIIVKATYDFKQNEVTLSNNQIPILFADKLVNPEETQAIKMESDMVPFKPKADIILIGTAYSPDVNGTSSFISKLKVGHIKKEVKITGDRVWNFTTNPHKQYEFSKPEIIKKMPLIYDNAFGGIDLEKGEYCQQNLFGKGYISNFSSSKTILQTKLPNIENPNELIQKWNDHPSPSCFSWYPRSSEPRLSYLGTYDETWRKTRSPLPPKDFDPLYYNGAEKQLQSSSYLESCPIILENLQSSREKTEFILPEQKPICTVLKEDNKTTKTFDMNCDTLCIMPDENRFYQVWRGFCTVKNIYALDIVKVEIKLVK